MREVLIIAELDKMKILAEPTRFKILELLRMHPMSITELSAFLRKDRSTVYRHIKALEKAGFVEEIGHEGNEKIYARTARLFLLKVEPDESIEEFRRQYLRIEASRLMEILKKSGIKIKDEEQFVKLVEEVLKEIEDHSQPILHKISKTDLDLKEVELLHLLNLLVFLQSCELCEKAKKMRELLEF
ncbi:ArsR family transcriptional regulator [Thermococcus sp. M39]|uniref:ArsR/SmtB family transcription factor n=1 Tax=unclassified Thermococcus TaxID=2627626 RepID=UPI00143AEFB5|nr:MULTISPECIES: winged helix-turn-helix domain-containing protein [unclassified Thermococcus]NJE08404.1 ArsR family transcriptional regulator [Thermococcus sp. M39]NJE11906.1 ArsR family transcriptional regulator [Thermococcus sp. LS2]